MSLEDIKKTTQNKMDQSIAAFKNNLTKIRTGRANPAILDTIQVDYYGSTVPLSQVANVSLIDSRTISVQPWEKNMAAKIEKAIRESDLGLNPASMGDLIRVPMPPMSEERRREMTKLVRTEGENAKIGEATTPPLANFKPPLARLLSAAPATIKPIPAASPKGPANIPELNAACNATIAFETATT